MKSRITGTEYFLPKTIVSNASIEEKYPGWNSAKVEKKVGIRQRHVAGEMETSMDLAVQAANILLHSHDRKQVDFLLFCTQSPEYMLPTSACIIQSKLGLRNNIGALDYNLGCSGYIYGLALAKGLINAGISKNTLLLTGETYSKFIADDDISNRSIFGDAGSATLICQSETEGIGQFVLGTDGAGAGNLIVEHPNARMGYSVPSGQHPALYMNGPEIFNFTIEKIPQLVQDTLSANQLALGDIDYVIMHQANKYILEFLAAQIGIDSRKCHIDMAEYGNTVSNSIPIAMKDAIDRKVIKPGDKVLLVGFGVGYSWGAAVVTI